METVQGVKLKKGDTVVFPITHIDAVKNENGDNLSKHLTGLLSGKADSSHSHAIYDITDLQSTLNDKANSSHSHLSAKTNYTKSGNTIALPSCDSSGSIQICYGTNVGLSSNAGSVEIKLPTGGNYIVFDWGFTFTGDYTALPTHKYQHSYTDGDYTRTFLAGGSVCAKCESQQTIKVSSFFVVYAKV